MIKDIFEDTKRHQSDNRENSKKVLVGLPESGGQFVEELW
jgi:hypothetical protein